MEFEKIYQFRHKSIPVLQKVLKGREKEGSIKKNKKKGK